MKHLKFLAAVCCMLALFTAMSITFVSCKKDKTDDPEDPSTEQNGGNQTEDETSAPVTYTLTVLSSNEEKGTVTGGGSYEEGTEATITATAERGFVFKEWNDENTDNPRVVTVTSDMTYTATFVAVPNGSENGHKWVDLGLPSGTKWATCNVGATSPEGYGNYYAWGETEPKTAYFWDNYKWCNGSSSTLTKYCDKASYGKDSFTDDKTVLDPDDDAARANWGGAWRMPTDDEWTELRTKCTWTWTSNYNGTGVAGRIVTRKTNGNHIFLPAAGVRSGVDLNFVGNRGFYWSSSLDAGYPNNAWEVDFYSGYVERVYGNRRSGLSVRPVLGK